MKAGRDGVSSREGGFNATGTLDLTFAASARAAPTLAPPLTKSRATAVWLLQAARYRGVHSSCKGGEGGEGDWRAAVLAHFALLQFTSHMGYQGQALRMEVEYGPYGAAGQALPPCC